MLEEPHLRWLSIIGLLLPSPPLSNFSTELLEKKRKRDKKGKETLEEGEIQPTKDQEPSKGAKAMKGLYRRSTIKGSGAKVVPDWRTKVPTWNLVLELDGVPLPMNSSIRDF